MAAQLNFTTPMSAPLSLHLAAPQQPVAPLADPPSLLERSPKWLICVPLTLQWLWLGLRYKSFTLPSAANPAITAGGLVGEGKLEYFNSMGPLALSSTADFCAVSTHCPPLASALLRIMHRAGLQFPVVAKPDLGLCGYGVRLMRHMDELQAYLAAFPVNEVVVLQRYLPQPGEAGIFYHREPDAAHGQLTGLALRYFPQVIGDGKQCLGALIDADPRAQRVKSTPQHAGTFDRARVPALGEVVRLATIGSTRVGGLYRDGSVHITDALTAAIDAIARDMPHFHFGRFDVRFDSLSELEAGRGFTIMEVNGAGSEAIQAWDPATGLANAFRMIFQKQRLAFATGHAMRQKGIRPISVLALARLNYRQNRLTAAYPPSN